MIAFRQRGLNNVYGLLSAAVVVVCLFGYEAVLPSVPGISLSENVNLLPYGIAVAVGMLSGLSLLRTLAIDLSTLGWGGATALALRQTLYVAVCIFGLMFAIKDREISRLFLGTYLVQLFLLLIWLNRRCPSALAKILFGERARLPTLFIGSTANLDDLDDWITKRGHLGIEPVGVLSDEAPTRADALLAPYLGTTDTLPKVLKERRVVQVILLEWLDDPVAIERLIEVCDRAGVRFLIHNNYGARFARTLIPTEEGGRHFLALQEEPLEDPLNRALKRMLDIVVALPFVVLALPPLIVLVALMQRLQAPGPLFFNRPRGGQNGREFPMLKFRSMRVHQEDVNQQATADDQRVFSFGRLMRKMSLDEFPQFLNVLRGEMSIVGPRPHLPQHDELFSAQETSYRLRGLVKPGITGLAQVRGYRGEITDPEKLERRVYWDLYYVTHWSWLMDIGIILKTGWQVVRPPESAY